MNKLQEGFKKFFDTPSLELPDPLPAKGKLSGGGWSVTYVTGKESNGEDYVDFYAQNRMTNSRHVRISADGSAKSLENYQDALIFDAETGEDWGKAAAKQEAHNQKVTQILEAKGLI